MAEQKERAIPERVEDFLDHHSRINVHQTNFNLSPDYYPSDQHEPTLEELVSILMHGLLPPGRAMKYQARGLKLPELNKRPSHSTWKLIFSNDYSLQPNGRLEKIGPIRWINGIRIKNQLRKFATDRKKLPALVFYKPKFPLGYNKARIQPRFILGVVLPEMAQTERNRWIEALGKFKKPLYDHTGKLVWKPGMEKSE
ncbi:MAG: hypothetical protein ABIG96_00285 [Candidatus Micrarchaeota archaeon]